jgi:2Fe-2S ferredoxin
MSDIKLKVIDRDGNSHELLAPTDMKMSLMEVLRSYDLIEGKCGGCGECSSCHIYIDNENDLQPYFPSGHAILPIGVIEDMMLDEIDNRKDNSRLSCQIHVYPNLDGLELTIGPKTK